MRRILTRVVVVVVLVSFATFLMTELIPGDPVASIVGSDASPERYAQVYEELGLDEPFVSRYLEWAGDALRGDLGESVIPPNTPVSERVARAFPVSLELAVSAVALALLVSVPLATLSAWRVGRPVDRGIEGFSLGVLSTPAFLLGLLLIIVVANEWQLLPRATWARPTAEGWAENLRHAALPVVTIALPQVAIFTRVLRSDLVSTLQEDYILAARARGLPTWRVLCGEALRPSSLSLVTLAGLSFSQVIGSTVIVEVLFSLPGMGTLIVDSASAGDLKVVQGAVLLVATAYVLVNAATDVLYGVLDPRSRRVAH